MTDRVQLFLSSETLNVSELNQFIEEQGGWSEPILPQEKRRQRNLSAQIITEGGGSIVMGAITLRVLAHVITEVLRRRRFHVSIAIDETRVTVEWSGDSKTVSEVSTELERIVKTIKSASADRLPVARLQIDEVTGAQNTAD